MWFSLKDKIIVFRLDENLGIVEIENKDILDSLEAFSLETTNVNTNNIIRAYFNDHRHNTWLHFYFLKVMHCDGGLACVYLGF